RDHRGHRVVERAIHENLLVIAAAQPAEKRARDRPVGRGQYRCRDLAQLDRRERADERARCDRAKQSRGGEPRHVVADHERAHSVSGLGVRSGFEAMRVDSEGARCFTVHVANKKRNRNSAARAAGRRSQAEAERTRTRILDRAEILFARRGYRGVSVRELSRACGVRPFTIQHHFGSKPGLYQAVLSRWDDEILARVGAVVAGQSDLATIVEKVVDELFDFFLEKRSWVTLTVRAALGEGLAKGVSLQEQSWVQFIDRSIADQKLGAMKHDLGLLLITV